MKLDRKVWISYVWEGGLVGGVLGLTPGIDVVWDPLYQPHHWAFPSDPKPNAVMWFMSSCSSQNSGGVVIHVG